MTNYSHMTALKSIKKGSLSICAVSEAHMIWKKQNHVQITCSQTAGGCNTRQNSMKTKHMTQCCVYTTQ